MKTVFFAALTALCAAGIPVPAAHAQTFPPAGKKPPPSSSPAPSGKTATAPTPFVAPKNEAEFIQAAVKCGMVEVKIAQLAVAKTDEAKVRDFAQLVVNEHTTANDELKKVAEGVDIPLEPADTKSKQKQENLSRKSGKEFDEAFLEEMAASHANDMALYEAGKKSLHFTRGHCVYRQNSPRRAAPGGENQSHGAGRPRSLRRSSIPGNSKCASTRH